MLRPDELATLRALSQTWMPLSCSVTRLGDGGTSGAPLPCAVQPDSRQVYPFNAIPDQAVQRWQVHLPADTDVQPNDLLTVDDGRIYVVLYLTEPGFYPTRRVAVCILSATLGGPLASAYLRANATVTCTRSGLVSSGRRVHLAYGQVNPAQPLQKMVGGVAILRIGLFDLPDADWRQGDGLTITGQDGPTILPGVTPFTLAGVVRRPLPYSILEADVVADV